jgi:ABC-type multidrug transport system ATPase subunit
MYSNDHPVDTSLPLWQRCGFVPIHNEHLRDLSVKETVKFAMLLRCHNRKGLSVVDDNVKKTIDILHLDSVQMKKTKFLNNGELKRVSIAEEMVHGPKLLYMDEPLTGISMAETSVLMNTFREMVNQDRTVIATVHQPSSDVFKLFDSVLLLSRGRVIYSGPVTNATAYFTNSPFQYNLSTYNNPADFFADVSGGFVSDGKGEFVDSSILEHHFKQSEAYGRLRLRLKRLEVSTPVEGSTTTNPLARPSDIEAGSISMSSTPDAMVSIAAEEEDRKTSSVGGPKKPPSLALLGLFLPFKEFWTMVSSLETLETAFFKGYVLFYRSIFALSNRRQILISSNITHIGLAIMFGWIMGDSSGSEGVYNTTAFFAMSCMFLILTNIPIGFYMFNNHGVFLKEHARDLYPNVLKVLVADYPLYVLRSINAVLFFVVAWAMINQTTDTRIYSFAVISYIIFVQTSVAMSEFVISTCETKRNFYERITGIAFLNILFSGLLIKASTLPDWLAPWASSCSLVRWSMQGNFVNLYDGSPDFSTLPNGYTPYSAFLSLYGWGGKTEWYCLSMMVCTYFVFKALSLWSSGVSALDRKGGAKFRQIVAQGYEL